MSAEKGWPFTWDLWVAPEAPYFLTACEHCGWIGSSSSVVAIRFDDDADTQCPACDLIFACDEIDPVWGIGVILEKLAAAEIQLDESRKIGSEERDAKKEAEAMAEAAERARVQYAQQADALGEQVRIYEEGIDAIAVEIDDELDEDTQKAAVARLIELWKTIPDAPAPDEEPLEAMICEGCDWTGTMADISPDLEGAEDMKPTCPKCGHCDAVFPNPDAEPASFEERRLNPEATLRRLGYLPATETKDERDE